MAVHFNPEEQQNPYKMFSLCISDEVLLSAIEELQRDTGMTEKELAKEAILSYLQEESYIRFE